MSIGECLFHENKILLRLDQEARHYNLGLKLYYERADEDFENI